MRSPLVLLLLTPSFVHAHQGAAPILHRFDAAVEAIMVPSDDERYAELNPAVHEPRIVLRNKGSMPLSGISIRYGTEGFLPRMFAWTGHLGSGASTVVELPHLIDMRDGANTFTVTLGDPNGRKDRDKTNNTLSTSFTSADLCDGPITVRIRVPRGLGGWARLESTRGPILLDRSWSAGPDTVFTEEIEAANGSYVLVVADSSKGGTPASVRIIGDRGELLAALSSLPKEGMTYQFRVEEGAMAASGMNHDLVLLTPPGEQALVDLYSMDPVSVVVRDETGEPIARWEVPARTEFVERIDLEGLRSGIYDVNLVEKGEETVIGTVRKP